MRIGGVETDCGVFLAPMAGVSDSPFRVICRQMGAGLVYSEMVSAKGFRYGSENTAALLRTDPRERPVCVQIFGSEPEVMAEMAERLTRPLEFGQDVGFDLIDINMGCPVPKIVKNGEGSALMRNPGLAGKIVAAVSRASRVPVTVKFRKGWDADSVNAVQFARVVEENGAAAVAVHGRTRSEYYSGAADWEIIARVKEAVSIPVIGNGDVKSAESAKKMLETTRCDGVMIARAAEGNPWIFRETRRYLETGELHAPPTRDERIGLALAQLRAAIEFKGEFAGIRESRPGLCRYIKGMEGAASARVLINQAESCAEIEEIMERVGEVRV